MKKTFNKIRIIIYIVNLLFSFSVLLSADLFILFFQSDSYRQTMDLNMEQGGGLRSLGEG